MKKFRAKTFSGNAFCRVSPGRRFRGRHLFVILLIAGLCLGFYKKVCRPRLNSLRQTARIEKTASEPGAGAPRTVAAPAAPVAPDPFEVRRVILHSGDTLAGIFREAGIGEAYADVWREACKSVQLDRFNENDELILVLSRADGLPVEAVFVQSQISYLLRKNPAGWECSPETTTAEEREKTVSGVWSKSFYDSCVAGGLPAPLISNLVEIFSYDIDFTSELKPGDLFSVFFQEVPIRSGAGKHFLILGAEVSVSGKVYQAFGFKLPDGSWDYFDAKGASLKRPFLMGPLNYRLMSSPKTSGNLNPASKTISSGPAIRYVVPGGTQICAVGDGFISLIRKHSARNFSIEIRHRGGYTSRYENLSAFSHGLKYGSPVSQAEVIGSMGSAGGKNVHLDFRLYRNRKPVNFQAADFARSKSVPNAVSSEFEKSRDFCAAALRIEIPDGRKHPVLSGRN